MSVTANAPVHVVCLDNEGYLTSLEVRMVYRCILDEEARRHGLLRVIDETGEDYLYPAAMFEPVDLPPGAARIFGSTH